MWHDTAHLLDILKAIRRVETFVSGVEYEGFLDDAEKHWAVASQLAVIGEAAEGHDLTVVISLEQLARQSVG